MANDIPAYKNTKTRPSTERPLMELLRHHILKDKATPEVAGAAWEWRGRKNECAHADEIETLLMKEERECSDFLDPADLELLEALTQQKQRQVERAAARRRSVAPVVSADPEVAPAALVALPRFRDDNALGKAAANHTCLLLRNARL